MAAAIAPAFTLVDGPLGLEQLVNVAGEDVGAEGTWNQFGRIPEPLNVRVKAAGSRNDFSPDKLVAGGE